MSNTIIAQMKNFIKENKNPTEEDFKTFAITIISNFTVTVKEEKMEKTEKKTSPKKPLSREMYLKWKADNGVDEHEKVKSFTGDQIATALKECGIDPLVLVGTDKNSKHKEQLTDALIEAYEKVEYDEETAIERQKYVEIYRKKEMEQLISYIEEWEHWTMVVEPSTDKEVLIQVMADYAMNN
jgi:hypothetical protein